MKKNQRSHSFSALAANRQYPPPTSFRQALGLPIKSKSQIKHTANSQIKHTANSQTKIKLQEKSFTDSQSSEASCVEKKFYRCGCLNHNRGGCGHNYQNYLAELRDKRLRKRANSLLNQKQSEDSDEFQLSEQQAQLRGNPLTAAKGSKLLKILEQPEEAENSKAKSDYSLSITIGRRIYFKKLKNNEELLACFAQIQRLIQGKL